MTEEYILFTCGIALIGIIGWCWYTDEPRNEEEEI
jgi:predicted acyltransferase